MPILTTTDKLSSRMRLRAPVLAGGKLVLPAGKVLNSADVDFLRTRLPGVSVSVEDPVLDTLMSFHDDAPEYRVAGNVKRQLVHMLGDVQQRFSSRMSIDSMDCACVAKAIGGVLDYMQAHPAPAVQLLRAGRERFQLVSHSAHVFYLSLALGESLRAHLRKHRRHAPGAPAGGKPAELDLTPLATAALFMDAALWKMPEIYDQDTPLTLEQCEAIRKHPRHSAAMLPKKTPEMVKLIIETHHENYDGTGYPYALQGDQIHIFSRILRIADAYSAATAHTLYRQACSPVRALWEMLWGDYARFYDPILLKLLAGLLKPFPIGAKVLLNTGRRAVVVRYGELTPFWPEVVIAFDEEGNRLPQDELIGPIKLHDAPDLRIVEFDGEDLSDLYEREPTVSSPTKSEFTTIYESVVTGCSLSDGASG